MRLFRTIAKMSSSSAAVRDTTTRSSPPMLDPRSFPRPPKLEKTDRHLEIRLRGKDENGVSDTQLLADTKDAYWVLETYHPPTYYLPLSALRVKLERSQARQTMCEWKGLATYWDLRDPDNDQVLLARARIWSYENPTPRFRAIKDYLCFYAESGGSSGGGGGGGGGRRSELESGSGSESAWDCFVDGERVVPQPGDFYGGWVTKDILGDWVKGAPGTTHW